MGFVRGRFGFDFEADIEGGGGVGDGADGDAVDAGQGDRADGFERDAAGGFEGDRLFAGLVAEFDGDLHAGAVHVVQQDDVDAIDLQHFA